MYFSFLMLRASLSGHVEIIEQLLDKVRVFKINVKNLPFKNRNEVNSLITETVNHQGDSY